MRFAMVSCPVKPVEAFVKATGVNGHPCFVTAARRDRRVGLELIVNRVPKSLRMAL